MATHILPTLNEIIVSRQAFNILTLQTYLANNFGIYCNDVVYNIIKTMIGEKQQFNAYDHLYNKSIICCKMGRNLVGDKMVDAWYYYIGTHWIKYETISEFNTFMKTLMTNIYNNSISVYVNHNEHTYNTIIKNKDDIVMSREIYNEIKNNDFKIYRVIRYTFSKLQYDLNDTLLSFNNCVYDYKEHITLEHNHKYLIFDCIGYDYKHFNDDDEILKDIEDFLNDIFHDKETKEYFMKLMAIYITKGNVFKNLHVFVGDCNIVKIIKDLVESVFGNYKNRNPMSYGIDVNKLSPHSFKDYTFIDNLGISVCDRYITYIQGAKRVSCTFIPIAYDHVIINNYNIITSHANGDIYDYKDAFLYTIFKYHKKYLSDGIEIPLHIKEFYNRIKV